MCKVQPRKIMFLPVQNGRKRSKSSNSNPKYPSSPTNTTFSKGNASLNKDIRSLSATTKPTPLDHPVSQYPPPPHPVAIISTAGGGGGLEKPDKSHLQVPYLQHQIFQLSEIVSNLGAELESNRLIHDRDMRFVQNLLYTLNQRGFLSITDQHGTVVELGDCKGEFIFDIKVKEQPSPPLVKQPKAKRIWANEFYYKAIIGNQEKVIQSLGRQLEELYQNEGSVNRSSSRDEGNYDGCAGECTSRQTSVIEAEILEIISLLEATCQRYPDLYYALRDQHEQEQRKEEEHLESTRKSYKPKSPRTISSGSASTSRRGAIVEKILDRCKSQIGLTRLRLRRPRPNSEPTSEIGVDFGPCRTEEDKEEDHSIIKNPITGSSSALTPTHSGTCKGHETPTGTKATFEIVDFEKFIGAAVLHVRGRKHENISPHETSESSVLSSVSPNPRSVSADSNISKDQMTGGRRVGYGGALPNPTTRNGTDSSKSCNTTRKKNKSILPSNKISPKTELGTSFLSGGPTSTPTMPNRLSPSPHRLPGQQAQDRGRGQSSANMTLANCSSPTGGVSASVSLDNQNQSLNSNSSSFPIVFSPKRLRSGAGGGTRSQSQSVPSCFPNTTPMARTMTCSPKERLAAGIRNHSSPRRPPMSSPLMNGGGGVSGGHKVGSGTERKQRSRSSYASVSVSGCDSDEGAGGSSRADPTSIHTHRSPRPRTGNSVEEFCRAGMSCPYCMTDFDKNMSPDDVRKHLEKHVFQR